MIQSSSCMSGMGSIQQGNLCFLTLVFLLLTSSSPATDGQIRLAGSGSTRCSGRVEIFYNNTWGTVCDDDWDSDNNKVVCRELGCDAALSAPETAYFGEGTGEIWLDDVGCSGSEKSLTECQHGGFGTNNCDHSEDVGVICSGVPIRLAGSGSTLCSGRVELYHNNTWGTVCDDDWDIIDAEVACRQFGCGAALNATQSAYFGEGTGEIWLDDVGCSGSERSVAECWHVGFGTHNCNHGEDAGVVCSGGAQIRLAGSGSTQCSGRVEIYHNNTWGTVCDDSWDLNDAEVVCREFGCGAALNATQSAYFGEGTGEIWLDDVGCSGSERSVAECRHVGFGTHDCGHDEDAGVVCSVPSLPLVSSIAGGGLLLLLLVLVVVCLVVRRRRRAKEPGVIAQTQLSVSNSNKYEEEQVDYVNVEPMATMRKETEQVGAVGDEDSDAHDYEEPEIADNYIVAAEVFVNKEEHGDEVETSDDENDYVNVTQHWSTVLH